MNYSAMIQNRKSVRAFTEIEAPVPAIREIRNYYETSVKRLIPQLNTQLEIISCEAKEALEGAAGYHRFLVGAPQYLVLLSERHELSALNAGYIMQDLVLNLTEMGLDSCWMTFTDSQLIKDALGMESELDIAAIVAFGYGQKTTKRLRLNVNSMSNVDIAAKRRYTDPKRSVNDMVFLSQWGNNYKVDEFIGFFDDMLWESFYAASLAPSYLNRQAYGFVIHNGSISLVERPDDYNVRLDADLSLGIAMLHFSAVAENWVGKLNWRLGEAADQLQLPEGHRVVASVNL